MLEYCTRDPGGPQIGHAHLRCIAFVARTKVLTETDLRKLNDRGNQFQPMSAASPWAPTSLACARL